MSRRPQYSSADLRGIWRSVLSWMHWSRRRRERRELEQEKQRRMLEEVMLSTLRAALKPLAEALQRQDSLLLEATAPLEPLLMEGRQVKAMQHEQMEMLGEMLNSLQPPARQQLGAPKQPLLFQSSAT